MPTPDDISGLFSCETRAAFCLPGLNSTHPLSFFGLIDIRVYAGFKLDGNCVSATWFQLQQRRADKVARCEEGKQSINLIETDDDQSSISFLYPPTNSMIKLNGSFFLL